MLQGGLGKLSCHLGILLVLLVLVPLAPLHGWPVGSGIVIVTQLGAGCYRVIQVGDIGQSQAHELQQSNPYTSQLKVI